MNQKPMKTVAVICFFVGTLLGVIVGANTHRYEFQHATYNSVLRCDKWNGTVERVHGHGQLTY
jgi:hypothetical protein